MFLGEPLRQSLLDLLVKVRERHGLTATYPHRDKSDHSACLLLEGTQGAVNAGAEDINKYMRSIYLQMRCLQLVISEVDKKELISNDLNRVKDIQGQCGVHLVLDPLPTDMNEASSTYDLRLPYTDHLLFETPIETDSENEFKPLRELLSVMVTSKVTGQNIVVSVIDTKTSAGGWNWGVNNVLIMLDQSADVGLNYTEIEQLDKGEVLVNTENATADSCSIHRNVSPAPRRGRPHGLTLLILLEQANDPSNQPPPNPMMPMSPTATPSIQLRTCNVPLPRNVRADDLLPSLAKTRQKVPLMPNQIPPVGTSPIILRGLTTGLRCALKTIKQLISSYAEARKNAEMSSKSAGAAQNSTGATTPSGGMGHNGGERKRQRQFGYELQPVHYGPQNDDANGPVRGADQLGRSLLGTDIWIGATECVALLRYFGIRCRIVQFSNFKPRTAHQVSNWVRKYFDEKYAKSSNKSMYESICSSSSTPNITMDNIVLPLYFQHEGHSRTIIGFNFLNPLFTGPNSCMLIGYEENINTGNFSLLVFDPFSSGTKLKNNLDKKKATWKTLVKRGLATLTRSAYQVIVVLPGIMSAAERELSK
ncbi:unnamed protein product, partial [Sphagnum compactum]